VRKFTAVLVFYPECESSTFEILVPIYQTARRRIPGDINPQTSHYFCLTTYNYLPFISQSVLYNVHSWANAINSRCKYMNSLVAGEKPAAMQHGSRSAAASLVHAALPLCTCACVFLFWSTLIGVIADTHCVPTAVRTVRWWDSSCTSHVTHTSLKLQCKLQWLPPRDYDSCTGYP
jgi:hypothetical protein